MACRGIREKSGYYEQVVYQYFAAGLIHTEQDCNADFIDLLTALGIAQINLSLLSFVKTFRSSLGRYLIS